MRVLLYLFTFFMSMAFFSSHTMAATITVDEQKMAIQAKELQQKPLLTQAIQLQGPSSSRDFYYTLKEDVQTDGHTVTFQIQHSTLLIAPSSFTVKVDDAAVKTVALTPDLLKQTVTVTLPKKALLKGTHKISTDFYGVIKEGVCVAPGNTGSWLSIDILSSISTFYGNAEALTLNDYPSAFLSYENRIVTLVLPDKASEATRNSSYQLAAYLSEQGDKNVDIKRESAMAQVTGPVIVVGAKGEFSTKHMQEILKNAKVQYEDALSLAIHQLRNTEGEQSIPALFVTAASAEAIEERISLLTDERLSKQLAGSVLTIDALPKVEKRSTTTIPLKQMGFENRTLSSQVPATPHYYVNLPQFEADKEATMRLVLKKSATLPKKDDDKDREVELVLHVNNVPHAVDLRELEQTSSDVYEVTIPIQTNVLNSQSMTDLQFEVTGFQLEDPCETTNEKYWLYIDDSSTLSMTKEAVNPTFTLRDFPNAFYDRSVIVEADGVNSDDTQMLYLYKTLMANGQTANTTIRKEKNVKENELK
ncbi:MAG: cellulose biosynthesis cyclic di-GMP-binding regulatory protein BcsB [Lysinibacillus sp.]